MKILQVGPNSVHVTRYIKAIDSPEFKQYLLSESTNAEVSIEEQFTVKVHTLNPFKVAEFYKKIKQIIHKIQPDIIHIHQVNRMAYFVSKITTREEINEKYPELKELYRKNGFVFWLRMPKK